MYTDTESVTLSQHFSEFFIEFYEIISTITDQYFNKTLYCYCQKLHKESR